MAAWSEPRWRPHRYSQCGKILRCLEQGGWWTTAELLHEVPAVIHSRIAELRKHGYTIEHRRTGQGANGSEYRLALDATVAPTSGGEGRGGTVASSATAVKAQPEPKPPGSPAGDRDGEEEEHSAAVALHPGQLSLADEDAAEAVAAAASAVLDGVPLDVARRNARRMANHWRNDRLRKLGILE